MTNEQVATYLDNWREEVRRVIEGIETGDDSQMARENLLEIAKRMDGHIMVLTGRTLNWS